MRLAPSLVAFSAVLLLCGCTSGGSGSIAELSPNWQADDFRDIEALGRAIGNARVVVLSEPSHGDGAAFLQKARILRYLHRQLKFDVVAWESGLSSMEQVDSALSAGTPMDTVESLGLLSFWRGAAEVRPTLEYIRSSRRTSRPIAVVGFDNQNTAVNRNQWTARVASVFGLPDTLRVRLRSQYAAFRQTPGALDSLAVTLRMVSSIADVGLTPSAPIDRQLLRRSIDDALVQVGQFREAVSRMPRSFVVADNNPRDRRMADNLLWQLDRFPRRRVVVWMASLHAIYAPEGIRDSSGRSSLSGLVSMGRLIHERLGGDVYTVAFTSAEGSFGSVYDTTPRPMPVPTAGSLEQWLVATRRDVAFINLRNLPAGHPLATMKASILLGYEPTVARWSDQIDGIFFVRRMAPVTRINTR